MGSPVARRGWRTLLLYRNALAGNTTAQIFWLKNRRPDRWRDVQRLQSELGVYILSDRPLSEQEWIEQRTVAAQTRKAIEESATETRHSADTPEDTEA